MAATGERLEAATAKTLTQQTPGFRFRRDHLYRLLSIISPILLLVAWQVTVEVDLLDKRFFPPPTKIFVTLLEMADTGEIFDHVGISLQRITLGFLLLVVTYGHLLAEPFWEPTSHVLPRAALMITLLALPRASDHWSMDGLLRRRSPEEM